MLINQQQKSNSVIIIGAGLAGLTAANEILKESPKTKVKILQAMDQPGGRTRSLQLNGAIFDLGAQWIGPPQKYVIELAKHASNQTLVQPFEGNRILEFGQQKRIYATTLPRDVGLFPQIHLHLLTLKVDRLAKTVPIQNPRDCPYAMQWDSMTVHTWIEQNIWFDYVRKMFEISVRAVIGCDTNQVSFLFFLWYIHQNHGLDCILNVENGLQCTKLVKGTQYLSFYLQKQIKQKGGQIFYNSFVSKVIQNKEGVIVFTRNGQKYEADYMVIAAPPPAVKNIKFEPQLSRERRFICDRYNMGGFSKLVALYKKQYWNENSFSGEILTDCHNGPLLQCYDDTRPKQNGQVQPAIIVLFAASVDEQWTRDQQNCKKVIVEQLASYFKSEEMLNPIRVEMKVWNNEESIGGAPTGYTPPGVLTKISNIREPEGRIHWAGTETARVSTGYMDGAIESGIRVSKQILERLNSTEQESKRSPPTTKWYTQIASFRKHSWINKFLWW